MAGGTVLIENDALISPSVTCESLARVGLSFSVPKESAASVTWFGRGPHENYPDRKRSALIGRHTLTARQLASTLLDGYVYPQSCGARSDVRWLALHPSTPSAAGSSSTDAAPPPPPPPRPGLLICPSSHHTFSLLPCSDEAIAKATHPHELA